ncbi:MULTISPECIES: hypothetical protein [Corynebacterium]|uniref:hypothetical protein n=1 Tax=Corynebacterium TaxID=1716 RepID=UPI0001E16BF2|nr:MULTISPECIES: hypothetical protein [Corynebacterium]ERS42476.1 hypothetical protein HMPREF1293_01068 [Corynebacterium sp. KPL1996]ERS70201.1 hypothetical protein HMPREF1300_01876 [Corynebacterium sp. KPL2004]EFM43852.1 hypothetical protein HMPREF0277_1064 [Corynebacterium accolens ATCC 49726]ERS45808.1 hypothetical protein HMPREF1287_00244 [Corynebacterium sp. KPL1986]MDK4270478.1 hypothetical protein [Corynebacterium accolens]
MKLVFKIVEVLFFLFLALFLLGGVAIIFTQSLGIVTLNSSLVVGVDDWLAPVTYACATLCAICAFVLKYRPKKSKYK